MCNPNSTFSNDFVRQDLPTTKLLRPEPSFGSNILNVGEPSTFGGDCHYEVSPYLQEIEELPAEVNSLFPEDDHIPDETNINIVLAADFGNRKSSTSAAATATGTTSSGVKRALDEVEDPSKLNLTSFDPLPIAPFGVRVVNNVSLCETPWYQKEEIVGFLNNLSACSTNVSINNNMDELYTTSGMVDEQQKQPMAKKLKTHQQGIDMVSSHHSIPPQQHVVSNYAMPPRPNTTKPSVAAQNNCQASCVNVSSYDTSIDCNEHYEEQYVPSFEVNANRFLSHQAEQWVERLEDLAKFRQEYGHCLVPHNYEKNPSLSQWIKRQRYQYKLKQEGKHYTLTDDRESALEALGFVWDSHAAAWEERLNELFQFRRTFGHCNVPIGYPLNKQLSIWVKCQRRQYKLYHKKDGKSNMTPERIQKLEQLGFVWNPRNLKY